MLGEQSVPVHRSESGGATSSGPEVVVLVHGLLANPLVMGRLASSLGQAFARTINWGYQSLWWPIERHGRELAGLLQRLDHDGHDRIHLVGHSMGGIIGRLALSEYLPRRFGRFVMIAPPNRGSHVASCFAPYLGHLFPPLYQLADFPGSFVRLLPPTCVAELGIIAAQTDFLVFETSTRLGCEADHITLPGLHTSLLWRQETAEQVQHFLHHGRFRRSAITSAGVTERS